MHSVRYQPIFHTLYFTLLSGLNYRHWNGWDTSWKCSYSIHERDINHLLHLVIEIWSHFTRSLYFHSPLARENTNTVLPRLSGPRLSAPLLIRTLACQLAWHPLPDQNFKIGKGSSCMFRSVWLRLLLLVPLLKGEEKCLVWKIKLIEVLTL